MGLKTFLSSLLLLVASGSWAESVKTPIRIGYVGGLTGARVSGAANKALNALKLAAEDINRAGGLLGRSVEVREFDNKGLAQENLSLFPKIQEARVSAVVGFHASNDALIMGPLLERARIPTIVASATHPDILTDKKYVARVCYDNLGQAEALSRLIQGKLKLKRVAIVKDVSDSFTISLSQLLQNRLAVHNIEILKILEIQSGQTSFDRTIAEVRDLPLDTGVIFSASAIESAYILAGLGPDRARFTLIGSDGWQNEDLGKVMDALGASHSLGRTYFAAHWKIRPGSKQHQTFLSKYRAAFREEIGDFDADAVLTYDAAQSLFEAIKRSGSTDSDQIMRALRKVQVSGLSGEVRFDRSLQAAKKVALLKIEKGKVSFLED